MKIDVTSKIDTNDQTERQESLEKLSKKGSTPVRLMVII